MYVPTHDLHEQNAVLALLMIGTAVGVGLAATRAKLVDAVGAAVLLVLAATWLRIDEPYEGRTILRVTASDGLTAGDLLAFPAAVTALVLLLRLALRRTRHRDVLEDSS